MPWPDEPATQRQRDYLRDLIRRAGFATDVDPDDPDLTVEDASDAIEHLEHAC